MKEILSIIKKDFPDKAINILEGLQLLREIINETMEDINKKMGAAFNNRDFDTVAKYTELSKEIHNYENKLDEIIDRLDIDYNTDNLDGPNSDIKSESRSDINYEDYRVDNNVEHTLYEDFTHIRPFGFKFLTEEVIQVKTWQEMLIKTAEILMDINEEKFLNFENLPRMNGKKNKYFSIEKNDMRRPIKVKDKIYLETNMSSNSIRNQILKMLKEYGYGAKDYKVYFYADYSGLNK